MKLPARFLRNFHPLAVAAAALIIPAGPLAYADPPPWAPAHGWRAKHQGYTGQEWAEDYGVMSGSCNRQAVGAVVGGVIGGAAGSQIGKGEGRTVATIVGTVLGAAIGAKVGGNMGAADQACVGHTLELAHDNARVTWASPEGVAYAVTPVRGFTQNGHKCREFISKTTFQGRTETARKKACRGGDGDWDIQG